MKNYYMIFKDDELLNITVDYYYFKRLAKKYKQQYNNIELRAITSYRLLENSTGVN